jgi:hypothetical protein
MPRPGGKKDDSIVGFNLAAEIKFRSIIGENGDHP